MSHHNLYSTAAWRRLRQHQLAVEPLCRMCLASGQVTAANTVDHIRPHRGDRALFLDPDNLQSLCKHCHDTFKQSQEKGGTRHLSGCDVTGEPLFFDW
jgi:5-methylcytosine-specific restriction enzyme A